MFHAITNNDLLVAFLLLLCKVVLSAAGPKQDWALAREHLRHLLLALRKKEDEKKESSKVQIEPWGQ